MIELQSSLYLRQPLRVPGVSRDDLLKPLEAVVDSRLIQRCRDDTKQRVCHEILGKKRILLHCLICLYGGDDVVALVS